MSFGRSDRPSSERPILVTGSHRSGSTFVGRMLAAARHTGYMHEPLNPQLGVRGVDRWFPYVRAGMPHEERYRGIFQRILQGRVRWKPRTSGEPGPARRLARALFGSGDRLRYLLSTRLPGRRRLIWKDPFACLASEYLHREMGLDVVILVRHPAAFAMSLARLDWSLGFKVFRDQPLLMRDYLDPVLEGMRASQMDIMEEASVLWRCIYTVVADYARRNPEMVLVRLEDISMSPVERFQGLFDGFGLGMTPRVRKRIRRLTAASNPVAADTGEVHQMARSSRQLAYRWQDELDEESKALIRRRTEPLVSRFYPEDVW
mgnify:CR=1 FL=1